jgi:AcrR family transcriptional regulator
VRSNRGKAFELATEQRQKGGAPPKGTLNEARWSEILDAAEDIFLEKGYEATTIEEIATRVGLLKASLYYYIQTKADLFYQISTRSLGRHLQVLQEDPLVTEGDAVSRLSCFVEEYMIQLASNCRWNAKIERDLMFLDADQMASLSALRHRIHLLLKGILTQGIAEGRFDPTMDASVATNCILTLMNGTHGWFRPTGRRSSPEIREWYERFILRGVMPDSALPKTPKPVNVRTGADQRRKARHRTRALESGS